MPMTTLAENADKIVLAARMEIHAHIANHISHCMKINVFPNVQLDTHHSIESASVVSLRDARNVFKAQLPVVHAYQECTNMIINAILFAQLVPSQLNNIKHVWLV